MGVNLLQSWARILRSCSLRRCYKPDHSHCIVSFLGGSGQVKYDSLHLTKNKCPCSDSLPHHSFVSSISRRPDLAGCCRVDYFRSTYNIKHRVQNPRRVTNPKLIASTHEQICPHCSATYALIASIKLATKILCDLRARHVKHHACLLALELSQKVIRQQQLTHSFSLPEGVIKLASLCEIYQLMLSISTKDRRERYFSS